MAPLGHPTARICPVFPGTAFQMFRKTEGVAVPGGGSPPRAHDEDEYSG